MKSKRLLSLVLAIAMTFGISVSGFAGESVGDGSLEPTVVSSTERTLPSSADNIIRKEVTTVYSDGITTVDELTAEYDSAESAAIASGKKVGRSAREVPGNVHYNESRDIKASNSKFIGSMTVDATFTFIPGKSVYINNYSVSPYIYPEYRSEYPLSYDVGLYNGELTRKAVYTKYNVLTGRRYTLGTYCDSNGRFSPY